MPGLVPSADSCCSPCDDVQSVQVPGPQGEPGVDGVDGTNGQNAFTALTAGFTMPAELSDVTITVAATSWMVPRQGTVTGQILDIQFAGDMEVRSITDATHAVVRNLEDTANGLYPGNAPPTTAIPNASRVGVSGLQGPAGTPGASGAPTTASYITQVPEAGLSNEQAMSLLATGYVKNTTATGVQSAQAVPIPITDGGTGGITAAAARTALAVAPSNATFITQVAEAGLSAEQSLAALATGYMKVTTATGVISSQAVPIPLADGGTGAATAVAARAALNVLSGYGILGFANAVDLNSATTDTAITMLSARYLIDDVKLESPSAAVTTATVGLFTAAGGGGVTLCADQAVSAVLTATTKIMNLAKQAIVGTDERTNGTLYFRVGTAEGAARTVNVAIWGYKFD